MITGAENAWCRRKKTTPERENFENSLRVEKNWDETEGKKQQQQKQNWERVGKMKENVEKNRKFGKKNGGGKN